MTRRNHESPNSQAKDKKIRTRIPYSQSAGAEFARKPYTPSKVGYSVLLWRLWVLITNAQPLRAWMFDGGLVIFSAQKHERGMSREELRGLGFNLWTQDRSKTVIWR